MPSCKEESLSLSFEGSLAKIEFSSPKANALSADLIEKILEAFKTCAGRKDLKLIILSSAGTGAFCSGASFEELKSLKTIARAEQYFLGFARIIYAIRKAKPLVVVKVQGKAVGGATGLIAAADYAIASEGAAIRLSELEIGIGPFVIEPILRAKLGLASLSGFAIDAAWRDAIWACEKGLYQKLCKTQEELKNAELELVEKISSYKQSAIFELKRVLAEDAEPMFALMKERAKVSARLLLS